MMLATGYADYYGIEPQHKGECDSAFRGRVAGALRDMGKIVEAHEAQANARIEASNSVKTGFAGALIQAMQGLDFGLSGEPQVGIDIAAGCVARDSNPSLWEWLLLSDEGQ